MGFWHEAQKAEQERVASLEASKKKKKEEDENMKKVMNKLDSPPQRRKRKPQRREYSESEEDEESDDGGSRRARRKRRRSPSPPPKRVYKRSAGKVKKGTSDFLQYGKSVASLLAGPNAAQSYKFLGKKYKRSLLNTLKNMVTDDGVLNNLLVPDEHAILKKNKAHVDSFLQSGEEFTYNPFEGDMSDIGKTVINVLGEVDLKGPE